MKKNLIFIGMPAVGKSTVGIVVAKRLGMQFIDTDLLIQEQEKKLLCEIIAEVVYRDRKQGECRRRCGKRGHFPGRKCDLLRRGDETL